MKILVMKSGICLFLACCCTSVVAAPAAPLPTVGVYDENAAAANTVDFEATGSTWSLSSVHQTIGQAYASDLGGVYQCQLNSSGRYLVLQYGMNQTKSLVLDGGSDFAFGVRASGGDVFAISGDGFCGGPFSSSAARESFRFDSIANGLPGERLIGMGLTILSSGTDYGLVTAQATFSDGTSATATRHIQEGAGSGDTFFGFTAPAGATLTGLTLSSPSGNQFWFDDVAFATVPEPSAMVLLLLSGGVLVFVALRKRAPRRA